MCFFTPVVNDSEAFYSTLSFSFNQLVKGRGVDQDYWWLEAGTKRATLGHEVDIEGEFWKRFGKAFPLTSIVNSLRRNQVRMSYLRSIFGLILGFFIGNLCSL